MEYCKTQIACLLIVVYIISLYYREKRHVKNMERHALYECLLFCGAFSLLMDGATAYTVNHLDTVDSTLNGILHCLFLLSLDSSIFIVALYMLSLTEGLPKTNRGKCMLCIPYVINAFLVIVNMPSLEYRIGTITNYSMGKSAYTCFIMEGVYMLFIMYVFFRRWNYMESRKRIGIFTCMSASIAITVYQMIVPEALLTSIATAIVILGFYVNQEAPMIQELANYRKEMVMGFATLVENRDNSTGAHVRRTTAYVKLLAEEAKHRGYCGRVLNRDYRKNLLLAAPMHDVGKIAIPDSILQKPGKLTEEEFEEMKLHTVSGGRILQDTFGRLDDPGYLEIAYQIALHHHEKWNGKGYPDGLKGIEIPLCARIMAIADVFDAVSEERCYRSALPLDECFDIIERGKGEDFDPMLAEIFLDVREKVEAVYHEIG